MEDNKNNNSQNSTSSSQDNNARDLLAELFAVNRVQQYEFHCHEVLSQSASESEELEDTEVADEAEDRRARFFHGVENTHVYNDWANGFMNRVESRIELIPFEELDGPFKGTEDEINKYEEECRSTNKVIRNIAEGNGPRVTSDVVDFGFRKVGSELVELNTYVPFMHRKVAAFRSKEGLKHESWECLCP